MADEDVTTFPEAVQAVRGGADAVEQARAIVGLLSAEEKLWLLDGDELFWTGMAEMMTVGYNTRPYSHGSVPRLGIPGLQFSDGPRGVVMGHSTAFPVSMARGASWDVALEERIGAAIGVEVRAQGGNFFAGVCINLPRHPAWGRAQETYSEDPLILGEMGAALTRGVRRHVMACVKHYALNSMENARFTVDVTADDATLHEVYLPHFRRVVEEGVDAVMTAYNSVNGEWCGQNRVLITDILREQWGFEGIAVSDFLLGLRDAGGSLLAGLDVEEPFRQQRAEHLPADLESGRVTWADVEAADVRILATQLRHAASVTEPAPGIEVVARPEHRALAREAAARSVVLLRNEDVDGAPLLPLDRASLRSLAVVGRLANMANAGDHGSSDVRASEVVTPLEGLRAALPGVEIRFVGEDDPEAAAAVAAQCDAVIVVAGFTAADEGEFADSSAMLGEVFVPLFPPRPEEFGVPGDGQAVSVAGMASDGMGGDRESLALRPVDERIILAVAAANPHTVVAVVAAGTVMMEAWRTAVAGVLMLWYAGMEGGHALADVLLGAVNPSGRLPFSIPTSEDHLPFFDRNATAITYDRWHGQRLLDRLGVPAAYPFGFGLSYGDVVVEHVTVERTGEEEITARVTVTSSGDRDAQHVVQLYAVLQDGDRAGERALVGFAVADMPAGGRVTVDVPGSLRPVSRWDGAERRLVVPSGTLMVEAASCWGDPACRTATLTLS